MKITSVTTYVHTDFPNVLHLEIATDEGIVGLGETYYFAGSVAAFIHEHAAKVLIGRDPLDRIALGAALKTYVGYNGSGIETRARAAVDIALWDIAGQIAKLPVHSLLGGVTNQEVRIYNTCAGAQYMRRSNQSSGSWGIASEPDRYEDLQAFLSDAGSLAQDLLAEGITAMKIWPFDLAAEANRGRDISHDELRTALEPIRKIRDAVGARMDIMVELHSLWMPSAARRIMHALREYDIFWVEDPIFPDLLDGLSLLRGDDMPRIALGETVASRTRAMQLFSGQLIDVFTLDIGWCGGLTDALAMTAMAESNGILVAPHDCTGPVGLTIGTHLSTAASNALMQETVRASLRSWYPGFVDVLPAVQNGTITATTGPGLGIRLLEEFKHSPDTERQTSPY